MQRELPCPSCGVCGLVFAPHEDAAGSDWRAGRPCGRCGVPIARERLEILPDAQYCTACQQAVSERGELAGPDDFCPRCGSRMNVRSTTAGNRSNYQLVCSQCGYRSAT
jgi:predicted RNA-binding Zn-ribbon protein involved in translation (DUF1610 family)